MSGCTGYWSCAFSDGAWTYTLDNTNTTVDALNTTSTALTDTITVTAEDGTTQDISIAINGTNDAATVSSATEALTESNDVLTASGTLTASDVDNTDNTFTTETVNGDYGSLTINTAGAWNYTASSAHDSLAKDAVLTDIFAVSSVGWCMDIHAW